MLPASSQDPRAALADCILHSPSAPVVYGVTGVGNEEGLVRPLIELGKPSHRRGYECYTRCTWALPLPRPVSWARGYGLRA